MTKVGGKTEKSKLPDGESNPGRPRDRRKSSPLDHQGSCVATLTLFTVMVLYTLLIRSLLLIHSSRLSLLHITSFHDLSSAFRWFGLRWFCYIRHIFLVAINVYYVMSFKINRNIVQKKSDTESSIDNNYQENILFGCRINFRSIKFSVWVKADYADTKWSSCSPLCSKLSFFSLLSSVVILIDLRLKFLPPNPSAACQQSESEYGQNVSIWLFQEVYRFGWFWFKDQV